MLLIAITIPCYNEQQRLVPEKITAFLKQYECYHFVFVDDGSTDKTGIIINELKDANPAQVTKLALNSNRGKANAVREGLLLSLLKKKYSFLGYWDADLSTGLDELSRLTGVMRNQHLDFVFGSRMKKLNARIQRSGFRHITGRIITTAIDTYFDLGIYDTQCGAKLFSAVVAEVITKEPFVTKWLFDVEIFLRIRTFCPDASGEEIPLLNWVSQNGSKITVLSTPALLLQFFKLIRRYPGKQKNNG